MHSGKILPFKSGQTTFEYVYMWLRSYAARYNSITLVSKKKEQVQFYGKVK